MRLVGNLPEEKQAQFFCSFLRKQGVQGFYEFSQNGKAEYQVWVEDEDALAQVVQWFAMYQSNPADPVFAKVSVDVPPIPPTPKAKPSIIITKPIRMQKSRFTNLLILICAILFLWNGAKELEILRKEGPLALQVGLTDMQRDLIFDYPAAYQKLLDLIEEHSIQEWKEVEALPAAEQAQFEEVEKLPSWKGVYNLLVEKTPLSTVSKIPMFEKIRQGEIWRLITPIFLHRDFLHILFNMAWLWLLGKQLEPRLGKFRMLILILITGVISNTVQYVLGGPYFLGFSGVACGMAGFIWMRQKVAPWEGYPLQKEALYFLFFFVIAMLLLGMISFVLELMSIHTFMLGIANSAHIAGGLVGIFLGRLSFFSVK